MFVSTSSSDIVEISQELCYVYRGVWKYFLIFTIDNERSMDSFKGGTIGTLRCHGYELVRKGKKKTRAIKEETFFIFSTAPRSSVTSISIALKGREPFARRSGSTRIPARSSLFGKGKAALDSPDWTHGFSHCSCHSCHSCPTRRHPLLRPYLLISFHFISFHSFIDPFLPILVHFEISYALRSRRYLHAHLISRYFSRVHRGSAWRERKQSP